MKIDIFSHILPEKYLAALVKKAGIPMGTLFKGVIPFLAADLVHVAFLVVFPQISTFLPDIMR